MLSSGHHSRASFAVHARGLALLVAAAFLALTAVGCSSSSQTGLPPLGDCSYLPSKCNGITIAKLCPTGGSCTVDSSPATCNQTSCTLESGQKLTIPLDGVSLDGMPDLLFEVVGARFSEANIHVKIDGKELVGVADPAADPYFLVKWADASSAPKKVEVSFTAGPEPQEIEVLFNDVQCHLDELSACHSGGA